MTDVKAEVADIQRSVEGGLRNLVRFGTQQQADQANETLQKLRLAQMDAALANLESRNDAILSLVFSLQSVVDGLRREPVGDALATFRSALADGELLLDDVQQAHEDEEAPAAATAPPRPTTTAAPPAAPATATPPDPARPAPQKPAPAPVRPNQGASAGAPSSDLKLPPQNERFRNAILTAAKRCGLAPSALAALIDAEAARLPDGGWNPDSANPRSSARGLTQFLSATWLDMAKRNGSFINAVGKSKGFIDGSNVPSAARKSDLLDLRFDAESSIVTAGEFGRGNLDFLAAKGCIPANADDDELARLAYLAHHEGAGGARAFINGSLSEERAERLLRINAGSKASALQRDHGSWRTAYTVFLRGYIDRKIQPSRYRA